MKKIPKESFQGRGNSEANRQQKKAQLYKTPRKYPLNPESNTISTLKIGKNQKARQ